MPKSGRAEDEKQCACKLKESGQHPSQDKTDGVRVIDRTKDGNKLQCWRSQKVVLLHSDFLHCLPSLHTPKEKKRKTNQIT